MTLVGSALYSFGALFRSNPLYLNHPSVACVLRVSLTCIAIIYGNNICPGLAAVERC
jgi:hypothetical protein